MTSVTDFTINILENNVYRDYLPFNCSAFLKGIPEYFACAFKQNEHLEECSNLPENLQVLLNFGGKQSIFNQYTNLSSKLWTSLFFSLMGDKTVIRSQNISSFFIFDNNRNLIQNLFSIKKVITSELFLVPLNSVATLFKESSFIIWRESKYLRIKIGVTDYFRLLRNKMIFSSVFQNHKEVSKYYPIGLVNSKLYEVGKRDFVFNKLGESLNQYFVFLPSYSTKLAVYYPQGYGQIFIIKIESIIIDAIPSFVQNNYLLESKPNIYYFIFTYLIFNMNGKIDFRIPLSSNITITFEMTKNFNETIFQYQGNIDQELRFSTYFQGDKEDFLSVLITINGTGFFNLQYKNFEMENFENIEPNNIIFTNPIETSAFTSICTDGYTSFETLSCLSSCSSFYFSPLHVCKNECAGLTIKGSKCECPASLPFYYFTYNQLMCLAKCPDDYPYFNLNLECVKGCPHFIFHPSKICVDTCGIALKKNSNCTCSLDKSFHYISDSGEIICETKCPIDKPFFNVDHLCLNSCSGLWFSPLKLCVDSCGNNLIKNGSKCECPKDKPNYNLNEKFNINCTEVSEDNKIRDILLSVLLFIFAFTIILLFLYFYRKHKNKKQLQKEKENDKEKNKENVEELEQFEEKDPFFFIEEPQKKYKTSYILDNKDLNLNFKTISTFKETKLIQILNSKAITKPKDFQENKEENSEVDHEDFQSNQKMTTSMITTDEDLIKKWKSLNLFYEIVDCDDLSILEPFQLKKVNYLARGGEGQIFKVQNKHNESFAYKCFASNVKSIDTESIEYKKLEKELELFKKLNNPFLVYADGVIYEKNQNLISYGIKINLMDLNLRQYIQQDQHKASSFETKIHISIQIINAIKNIHLKNVVHYDIKPENILLEKYGKLFKIKISDFGLAQEVKDENDDFQMIGISFMYASPEYLVSFLKAKNLSIKLYYKPNFKDDIWSFGLILHDLFFGPFEEKLPYLKFLDSNPDGYLTEEKIEELRTSIFEASTTFRSSLGNENNDKINNIINECLQIDSEKRPNAEQVREMLGQICKNKDNLI